MKTRLIPVALVAAMTLCSTARAAEKEAADTAAAVRSADIAFENRAQEVGPARAFRETMDEKEGLQFDSGAPTRGAEAIYNAMGGDTPSKTRLEWTPIDAWGSRAGDLGVTTGTWRLYASPSAPSPTVTGRYVTVWRRNVAGVWKGLIDIGNPDPKPAS
jgi:ketosteroid isomerase-like protein